MTRCRGLPKDKLLDNDRQAKNLIAYKPEKDMAAVKGKTKQAALVKKPVKR